MKVLFTNHPMQPRVPDLLALPLKTPLSTAIAEHVRPHLKPKEQRQYTVHLSPGMLSGFVRIGLTKELRRIPFTIKGQRKAATE